MDKKTIGIVGGIGNYAALDLIKKIYDMTDAKTDQEHLPIALISEPHRIPDRTDFLLGKIKENPGLAIAEIINTLITMGSSVIGIPCNTAHARPIHDVIKANLHGSFVLIHMIEEVGDYLNTHYPQIDKVGLLATNGTVFSKVYPDILKSYDLEVITPSEEVQHTLVHDSIFNFDYGIKAFSNPVNLIATENLMRAARHLIEKGGDAIILGCTEIPLAINNDKIDDCIVIDPTTILAAALIKASLGS